MTIKYFSPFLLLTLASDCVFACDSCKFVELVCGDLWGSCQFMITASDSFGQIVGGGVLKSCGEQEEIGAKVAFHAWNEIWRFSQK